MHGSFEDICKSMVKVENMEDVEEQGLWKAGKFKFKCSQKTRQSQSSINTMRSAERRIETQHINIYYLAFPFHYLMALRVE